MEAFQLSQGKDQHQDSPSMVISCACFDVFTCWTSQEKMPQYNCTWASANVYNAANVYRAALYTARAVQGFHYLPNANKYYTEMLKQSPIIDLANSSCVPLFMLNQSCHMPIPESMRRVSKIFLQNKTSTSLVSGLPVVVLWQLPESPS